MSSNHYRGKVAALSRSRAADDPELVEAKRNYHAEKLAERVGQVVNSAPPMTTEQVDRIVSILRGGVRA
ncbi:MAG: hypothetical protein QM655_02335 [Nocardioidaceae bacterium]